MERDSLLASFNDITIFHIFFKDIKVLKRILIQLDQTEFAKEFDKDDNEIENQTLRRIYYILARHRISKRKLMDLNEQSEMT